MINGCMKQKLDVISDHVFEFYSKLYSVYVKNIVYENNFKFVILTGFYDKLPMYI